MKQVGFKSLIYSSINRNNFADFHKHKLLLSRENNIWNSSSISPFRSSFGDIPSKTGGNGWPGLGRSKRNGVDTNSPNYRNYPN